MLIYLIILTHASGKTSTIAAILVFIVRKNQRQTQHFRLLSLEALNVIKVHNRLHTIFWAKLDI